VLVSPLLLIIHMTTSVTLGVTLGSNLTLSFTIRSGSPKFAEACPSRIVSNVHGVHTQARTSCYLYAMGCHLHMRIPKGPSKTSRLTTTGFDAPLDKWPNAPKQAQLVSIAKVSCRGVSLLRVLLNALAARGGRSGITKKEYGDKAAVMLCNEKMCNIVTEAKK